MSKLHLAPLAAIALLMMSSTQPPPSHAAVSDLPGFETAANMKEWLKLTDDQVAKLEPVIATRVEKTDAALAKVEAAEKPDALGFIKEYGAIKKEFNTGVTAILTPDQSKQWGSFKAELEKSLVKGGALNQLAALQPALKLTDEQVAKLEPAMTVATQKKIDVLQKLADGGRIGVSDKLRAKRTLNGINDELEKAMAAVVSPEQLAGYKEIQEKKKKEREAKKK